MFEYPYVGLWNVTCAGFAVKFPPASAHTKTYKDESNYVVSYCCCLGLNLT